jgi:hypothetical protein
VVNRGSTWGKVSLVRGGAKGMKNRNKTKMSKRKHQEIRRFRGPRCRFGAFVSRRDVAVRSTHVFSRFSTEAAAQSTKTSCFLASSSGHPTVLCVFSLFLYTKISRGLPPCAVAIWHRANAVNRGSTCGRIVSLFIYKNSEKHVKRWRARRF